MHPVWKARSLPEEREHSKRRGFDEKREEDDDDHCDDNAARDLVGNDERSDERASGLSLQPRKQTP